MSEEAKKFIEVTDLVDHTDYENSDCGEGYILNDDHLADLLEAYHQERMKEIAKTTPIESWAEKMREHYGK